MLHSFYCNDNYHNDNVLVHGRNIQRMTTKSATALTTTIIMMMVVSGNEYLNLNLNLNLNVHVFIASEP